VRCMGCEAEGASRELLQQELLARNPDGRLDAREAPDGEADLDGLDFRLSEVPVARSLWRVLNET